MEKTCKIALYFICSILLIFGCISSGAAGEKQSWQAAFGELCEVIEKRFYSRQFVEHEFPAIKERYGKRIEMIVTGQEYKSAVRDMLKELKVSHTSFFTPEDPEYYQLSSILEGSREIQKAFHGKPVIYPTIGIFTREIEKKCFVTGVLEGSPAQKGGLLRGDEILSCDGKPSLPIISLRDRIGKKTVLSVRRDSEGSPVSVAVYPVKMKPAEEFLGAEKASISVIQSKSKKIGYIHVWCYAGEEYHNAFLEAINDTELKDADALIWDLRDGWGGADPVYLNAFNRNVPQLSLFDREGREHSLERQWKKPVVMLVNGGTRSGKEILAYGFKKYGIGKVIGEKTAGAVVGGSGFMMKDGSLLYLAVAMARVDGEVLEGEGVKPDIEVPMDIRYSKGRDIQKEKAIEYLVESLAGHHYSQMQVSGASPMVK